ncbi:MAG: hypothetical protein DPW18_01550 [Chloroflexi bacterium]|nr:hypothetical protein [Chloroflexota bacterium]MDL1943700.1 hypothetical protein [Chloroflexi bacterium CFX2]
MFQIVEPRELFDPRFWQVSEDNPAYWLAQLRKADWHRLLNFVNVKMPMKTKKQALAEAALQHFEFMHCDGRGEVWQLWTATRKEHRALVIQFRHSESDWSRGLPEFVDLDKNEPLGFVNIAGRLFCKVK